MINLLFLSQVVLIGDSLTCGPMGERLFEHLQKKYDQVTLFCAVSSAPSHWIQGKNPPKQVCMTRSQDDSRNEKCHPEGQVPKLEKILRANPYADIVVALGTNSLMDKTVNSFYVEMIKAIESRKCSWIAPPHLNPHQARGFPITRLQLMEKNLGPFYHSLSGALDQRCKLIDSRPFTVEGSAGFQTTDGVHRTQGAGRFWADEMSDQL